VSFRPASYSGLSLPYRIGNGWSAACRNSFAMVKSSAISAGLVSIVVSLMTFVIGMLLVPDLPCASSNASAGIETPVSDIFIEVQDPRQAARSLCYASFSDAGAADV
jgi:hypothetical protein